MALKHRFKIATAFFCTVILYTVFLHSVFAATNIYYSVGQNTSDHKTGSPTVTIDGSGNATFSIAQTATNMGVGDKVTFGGTSVFISGKQSTSVWSVITATGILPAATTSVTVTSIAHAFSSLNNAVGTGVSGNATSSNFLNTSDLISGDYVLNIPCYFDSGSDATAVVIAGFTTNSTHYIRLYTATSTATEVNQNQRNTTGVFDSNIYVLNYSLTAAGAAITINTGNVRVEGLQIEVTAVTSNGNDIKISPTNQSVDVRVSNNILFGRSVPINANRYAGIYAILGSGSSGAVKAWDNVIYNFTGSSAISPSGILTENTLGAVYAYNNTIYNTTDGILEWNASGTTVAKNNLIASTTNPGVGTFAAGTDYNSTASSSIGYTVTGGGNTHDLRSQTFSFNNVNNKDFRLISSDTGAKDKGADLSADANLAFNSDNTGIVRPQGVAWDIGAFEFTTDATPPTVTAFAIPSTSTSTTISISSFTATDNLAVTGYLVNESSSTPSGSDPNWSAIATTTYAFFSQGSKTLYAWAKDAIGNISSYSSATTTVDTTAPTVAVFSIPATASSTNVSITSFTASDNIQVADYLLNQASSTPLVSDSGWQATTPASYTFPASGNQTLYAWVKDEAGNVSTSASSTIAITACYVVTPAGSGNHSGSDWNNSVSASSLPSFVTRGSVYYLSGGSYGNPTFNTADRGTDTIIIRAATASDHCTDAGWSSNLAATPTNQVSFRDTTDGINTFHSALQISTDHWLFDGDGGWTNRVNDDNSYNMIVDASWPAPEVGVSINGALSDITFKYVQFNGFGLDLDGADSASIASISCSNNTATISLQTQRDHAYLYPGQWIVISGVSNTGFNTAGSAVNGVQITSASSGTDWTKVFTVSGNGYTCPDGASDTTGTVSGPATASDEMFRSVSAGASNLNLQYDYWKDSCNPILLRSNNSVSIDHSAFLRNSGNVVAFHCEIISDNGSSNLTFSNNLALDLEGTGYLIVLGGSTQRTVTGASWSGGTAMITLASGASDYAVGNFIGISGISPSGYNGVYQVTATSTNTISYALASNPGTYSLGGSTYIAALSNNWDIYGNIFGYSYNNPYARVSVGDGQIVCINSQRCENFEVYQNTFVGGNTTWPGHWGFGGINNSLCLGNIFENNLLFATLQNSGTWDNSCANTEDYNSYINLSSNVPNSTGAHDSVSNSLPDPFRDESTHDYSLSSEMSQVLNGLSLTSPFDVDPSGTTRGVDGTWDRGAYEFNTNAPVTATVSASAASSISTTAATLNGSIDSTGGANPTIRGFEYGLTTSYGTIDSTNGSYSSGSFTDSISNLTCNTAYHFRAFATNSAGTASSSDSSFTTSACSSSGGGGSGGSSSSSSGGFTPYALQAYLAGLYATTTATTSLPASGIHIDLPSFKRSLYVGSSGNDVQRLQTFLNIAGFTVATKGPGSRGHETTVFGSLTKQALMRFQIAYRKQILDPAGLKNPTGIFGAFTMKLVNSLLGR